MPTRFLSPVEEEELFTHMELSQARRAQLRQQTTPDQGRLAADLARDYSRVLKAGDITALARAGFGPDHPVTKELVTRRTTRRIDKQGGTWSDIGERAFRGFKGTVRTALTVLETPLQELQGGLRALAHASDVGSADGISPRRFIEGFAEANQPTSTGSLALQAFTRGEDVDLGTGFLPRGEIRKQHGREQARYQVGGQGITTGRLFAQAAHATPIIDRIIQEPGTESYNLFSGLIDATFALGADPSNVALGTWAKIAKAKRGFSGPVTHLPTFERWAKGVSKEGYEALMAHKTQEIQKTLRATVNPKVVSEWINLPDTQRFFGQIGEAPPSPEKFQRIYDVIGHRAPVEIIMDLNNTTDPAQAAQIFENAILAGHKAFALKPFKESGLLRQLDPNFDHFLAPKFNKISPRLTRLNSMMPGRKINWDDPTQALEEFDRLQRNVVEPALTGPRLTVMGRPIIGSTISPEQAYNMRAARNHAFAKALLQDGVQAARNDHVLAYLGDTRTWLNAQAGLSKDVAHKIAKAYRNVDQHMNAYSVDNYGRDLPVPGSDTLVVNGIPTKPDLHVLSEVNNAWMPLPDPRALRDATRLFPIFNHPAIDMPLTTANWLMQQVWKPMVLLRGAWTVRVIAEEQVRMATAGLSSAFAHPISFISWAVGEDAHMLRKISKETGEIVREGIPIGRAFAKLGIKTGRGGISAVDENWQAMLRADTWTKTDFAQAHSTGSAGWVGERNKITMHGYSRLNPNEEGYTRAWAVDELAIIHSDPSLRAALDGSLTSGSFWDGKHQWIRKELIKTGQFPGLTDRATSDAYAASLYDRVNLKTVNDPVLKDALITGELDDAPIFIAGRNGLKPSKQLSTYLTTMMNQGKHPGRIRAQQFLKLRERGGFPAREALDAATEFLFSVLMTRPSNYLSRSVTFRQAYWQRIQQLSGLLAEKEQRKLLKVAVRAKLSDTEMQALASSIASSSGDLAVKDIDLVAKGHALDFTRELLYDLHNKTQWADAARLIFPFAEAYKEILTRWAKLGITEGKGAPVRRLQQIIQGARGADANSDGLGFFHTDDTTLEEVFTYPGSGLLTKAIIGQYIPLEGRVQGLNMVGNIIPGFGPAIQVPISYMLPDQPEFDWVRDIVMPFGEPKGVGGIYYPPWLEKALVFFDKTNPDTQRLYMNTVWDIARHMTASGEATMNSPEEVNATLNEAKQRAKGLYLIRGLAQFWAPSAPSPKFIEYFNKDPQRAGDWLTAQALVKEYYNLLQEDYDSATSNFIDRYGSAAYLYLQPTTRSLVYGVPVTKEGSAWARKNRRLAEKFPNVYGFFAPQGGEFDYTAYLRTLETGEKVALTPEQMTQLANNRMGQFLYEQARSKAGPRPTAAARDWLRQVRTMIEQVYPGFQNTAGIIEKLDTEHLVAELERASADPAIRRTEAGQGLQVWFVARTKAIEQAQSMGLQSFSKAQAARPIRDWLRAIAIQITARYPEFAVVYDQALFRELDQVDDELYTPEAQVG